MKKDLPIAGWKERSLVLIGVLKPFKVEGNSMRPVLTEGDVVLVKAGRKISVGDIVLIRHPYRKSVRMIKRVSAIKDDGSFDVAGDDPAESTDSRTLGAIQSSSLVGTVTCRLR